ncbi:hypothetical protein [Salinisphaera shabanensis]|uniref:hypothetical protein n=1 Tax=Salinisphaera shabanensis TaxID=180542 RepID=UPI00333FE1EA
MSEERSEQPIWPVVVVIILVGYAFYVGIWIGIATLIAGVIVLGWSRRHDGPLPTKKSERDNR